MSVAFRVQRAGNDLPVKRPRKQVMWALAMSQSPGIVQLKTSK